MNHKLQCWIFALLFVASIFTKSESFAGVGGVDNRNTKLQVRKISPIKPLLNLKPLLT